MWRCVENCKNSDLHVFRLPMSHAETTLDRADVLSGRFPSCHSFDPSARLLLLLLLFLLLSSAWGNFFTT